MLKIALCEDVPEFLSSEKRIITEYLRSKGVLFNIDEFISAEELLADHNRIMSYSLIIMDVELGGIDGIDAAREIRQINDKVEIAFLSAHMNYSTEGYRVRAIRFILKNESDMHSYIYECLDCVLKNIDANERTIKLDFTIGQHTIPIAEIIYLKSSGNYTVFVLSRNTNKEEYKIRYPLKKQSEIMESFDFIPVNAKETVNLSHVKSVTRYTIVLDNGESHQISQKKYNDVIRSFTLYRGKHL